MLPSYFSAEYSAVYLSIGVGILVLFLFRWGNSSRSKSRSFPGVPPSDPVKGNLDDICKAGSLHQFLMKLHKDYGPFVSFWWAERQVVSIASPKVFKEIKGLIDRPVPLFEMFQPIFPKQSVQFVNGTAGLKRHKVLSNSFTHHAMSGYYETFTKISEEKAREWESFGPEDRILLQDSCFSAAAQAILLSVMGPIVQHAKYANEFIESYHTCWNELENKLSGKMAEEGSEREQMFKKGAEIIETLVKHAADERRKAKPKDDEYNLIDNMIKRGYPEEMLHADLQLTVIGGIHTSALLLIWSIYFMSKHPGVQERVYEELKDVLDEETVTPQVIGQLTYMRQVLYESLRCATIASLAARCSEHDEHVGGYKIPKKTPIIIALGVEMQDPEIWPEPQRFDPDRFSPEEMKERSPWPLNPLDLLASVNVQHTGFPWLRSLSFCLL